MAILTLALGIGANTAIFSVIDSILLQPLPFPQAGRLVELVDTRDGQAGYNYPKGWIREYQRRAASFSSISAYTLNAEDNVAGAGSSDRAFGLRRMVAEIDPAIPVTRVRESSAVLLRQPIANLQARAAAARDGLGLWPAVGPFPTHE